MKEQFRQLINFYIKAKDHHQPYLMELAFAEDANLKMVVNTDAIAFPAETLGLKNISAVLVEDFHTRFDNVYTFCVSDSVLEFENELRCTWLVGMTDIDSGSLRLGYGEYHWEFTKHASTDKLRVQKLVIVINSMNVFPEEKASLVLPWLDSIPHPWSTLSDISMSAPDISSIHEFLKSGWSVTR